MVPRPPPRRRSRRQDGDPLSRQRAAVDPACEVSYRELVAHSCKVTNLLRELGLGIEDRVLLLMPDTPAFVACYFGVLRAGCVAVPANNWLLAKDYAYYLEYARPKAVIVDAEIWPAVDEARRSEGRHTKHYIVHDCNGATTAPGHRRSRRAWARRCPTPR